MSKRAFTLVELLVTVAIIAILAAIAIPNFLEAQARSKVSRAKADMRTIRTALEAYAVDEGSYPLNAGGIGLSGALLNLSTPRAYLTSIPRDVFLDGSSYAYYAPGKVAALANPEFGAWVLSSAGPDRIVQTTLTGTIAYDPTNGTISRGDVVTSQKRTG